MKYAFLIISIIFVLASSLKDNPGDYVVYGLIFLGISVIIDRVDEINNK